MAKTKLDFPKILIIANGEPLSRKRLLSLGKNRFILALDGGAETCRKLHIAPHIILGDFDGVSRKLLFAFQKKGSAILYAPDQSQSDMEKALRFCRAEKIQSISISCALGLRSDHALANLSFLKKYSSKNCEIVLFNESEEIRFVRNQKINLAGRRGARVSLLGLNTAKVNSRGLVFPMKNYRLNLGVKDSLSNALSHKKASLTIHGSALLILGNGAKLVSKKAIRA